MRILVVEDDRKVASFIQTGLEQEGYAVDVLHDGDDAGEQARAVDYDAVVLDLMLPGRSGFQVLRDIRARKASLPVLILTAKDSVEERVAGLDSGADDYMVKPFALAELSARLRALLRRGAPRETVLRVADLEMDTVRRTRPPRRPADRPEAEGVRAARVPDAQQRSAASPSRSSSSTSGTSTSTASATSSRCTSTRCATRSIAASTVPLIHTIRGVGYMLDGHAAVMTADAAHPPGGVLHAGVRRCC